MSGDAFQYIITLSFKEREEMFALQKNITVYILFKYTSFMAIFINKQKIHKLQNQTNFFNTQHAFLKFQ